MNGLFDILFPLLFAGAIAWLVSVFILIRKLGQDYPETYRALGEPRFNESYTPGQFKALLALIRFILKREHQSLNDVGLSRLCDFMRILFVAYLVGFAVLFISTLGMMQPR